jgi:hypothetical protein
MSALMDVVGRIIAFKENKAFPIRSTWSLAPDPSMSFGVTTIKIVSEEIVQAIAFGSLDRKPSVVTRWNPLSRDSGDLEPFAIALNKYLQAMLSTGNLPRIWVPHQSALGVIELLGHRYRTNTKALETLRRMGAQCQALAIEERYPGQQVVAVAGDLLRQHAVTGQAPLKDFHLGAILAWFDTPPGRLAAEEADRCALVPASGVLERRFDDEVEVLRNVAKKGGKVGNNARKTVERRLLAGALKEWSLLLRARRVFWKLPLRADRRIERLVKASHDRVAYSIPLSSNPASRPHSLASELTAHEEAADLVEEVDFCADDKQRERAFKKGRAVRAKVERVMQPSLNRKPCKVFLRTTQEVLRVRRGTVLQRIDGLVLGRVDVVREDSKGTVLELDLLKGVRRSCVPNVGQLSEWVDAVAHDMRFVRSRVYGSMKFANSQLVYDHGLSGSDQKPARIDLLKIAQGLRR